MPIYSRLEVAQVCNAMLRVIFSRQIHREPTLNVKRYSMVWKALSSAGFSCVSGTRRRYETVRKAVGDIWGCADLFDVELVRESGKA